MLQWALYVLVISVVLSIAGLLAEQALRRRRLATRIVWLATLALCVALSVHAWPVPGAAAVVASSGPTTTSGVPVVMPLRLPDIANVAAPGERPRVRADVDAALRRVWVVGSALVAAGLLTGAVQVYLRRRRWPIQMLDSHCVAISRDVGPAVIGLLRPTIVLPEWILSRSPAEQRLIVAHEASHLAARDSLSLSVAVTAVMLFPWNPLLWWQLRRLRHALEVDCDARVLSAGHGLDTYGAALIEVGQRKSRYLGTVAAMSENRTLLEERIEVMSQRSSPVWQRGFVALCVLSVSVAFAATQVTSPSGSDSAEVKVDADTLDHYLGHYQVARMRILTVTRDGGQLFAELPGAPAFPLRAESATKFRWQIGQTVVARVTFSGDADGLATVATIHQSGADVVAPRVDDATAAQAAQELAARIAAEQPQSGSETALRKTIGALVSGSPNYADMDDMMQNVLRQQQAALGPFLSGLGAVQTLEFKGVADSGADKYLVTHQGGKQSQWMIALGADGRIVALVVLPVF